MQIEYLKIDDVIPYINNPRNNEDAVEKVAASIKEYGFRNPVIIDKDNVIIAGHTRYNAAKRLKLDTIPIIRANDLTSAQIKGLRIADNKTSEYATWNNELLTLELESLQELNFDLELTGFNMAEIDEMMCSFDIGTEEEQGDLSRLEDKEEKTVCCPNCGEEITI